MLPGPQAKGRERLTSRPPDGPAPPNPSTAQGVGSHIKLKAAGELQPSGKREVFFEANGVPRVVEVVDKRSAEGLAKKAVREKVGARAGRGRDTIWMRRRREQLRHWAHDLWRGSETPEPRLGLRVLTHRPAPTPPPPPPAFPPRPTPTCSAASARPWRARSPRCPSSPARPSSRASSWW
jgi:hypothetical protein